MSVADLGVAVAIVGKDQASGPIGQVTRALSGISSSASASTNVLGRLGSTLGQIASGAVSVAAGFATFQIAQRAFEAASEAAIGFNARMEQVGIAFKAMLGSAENARAFLFDLQRFAAVTPFSTENVLQATRLLLGMGFAAQDVKGILTDLGNVAAGLGLDSSGVERLATVLGQMHTTGRVLGQDLLQLSQAGVNVGQVFQIMSEQTGKSVAELKQLQSQGQLDADLFIKAFREWSQTRFGDAMAGQAHTFLGALSTIKDSLLIVASTAFKPLFDRISELAQRIAAFVSSDDFSRWAAKVAAGVDIALDALGTLARGFGSIFSTILSVAVDIGQAIYQALQWINPFARHSPSLVEQVNAGVDAIITRYEQLGLIQDPVKAAGQALQQLGSVTATAAIDRVKQSVDALKDRAQLLSDALTAAKDRLRALTETPIQGEGTIQNRIASLQDQLNRAQLALVNAQISRNRPEARAAQREIQRLQLLLQQAQLQEHVQFDPLRCQIEQAANPRREMPFAQIISGIHQAQQDIATLQPALDKANQAWQAQASVLQKLQAAAANAKTALIGTNDALKNGIGDLSFLDKLKTQLADWDRQFAEYRAEIEKDAAPFLDAINSISDGMERFARVIERLRTDGLAGGLTELLFPTVELPPPPPVNDIEAERQASLEARGRIRQRIIQHPTLALSDAAAEAGRRIGETFNQAIEKIDWEGIGRRMSSKLTVTFERIDWGDVLQKAAFGIELDRQLAAQLQRQDFHGVGRMLGEKLTAVFSAPIPTKLNVVVETLEIAFPFAALSLIISQTLNKIAQELGGGFVEGFWKGIGADSLFDHIGQWIQDNIFTPFNHFLGTSGGGSSEKMGNIGIQAIEGFWSGIVLAGERLILRIPSLLDRFLIQPFCSALGIHSPSTLFASFGVDLVDGLILGIQSKEDALIRAVEHLGRSIWEHLGQGFDDAKKAASGILSTIPSIFGPPPTNRVPGVGIPPSRSGFAGPFAMGGSFVVGGSGGIDSQLVTLAATPGERITVTRPGESGQGVSIGALIGNVTIRSEVDVDRVLAETRRHLVNLLVQSQEHADLYARSSLPGALRAR